MHAAELGMMSKSFGHSCVSSLFFLDSALQQKKAYCSDFQNSYLQK